MKRGPLPPGARPFQVALDLRPESLSVSTGDRKTVIPLERDERGLVAPSSRERVTRELVMLLGASSLSEKGVRRRLALCTLSARGVSLRRIVLPGGAASAARSTDETHRMVALQLEAELPLPPDQMAWGAAPAAATNGTAPPSQIVSIVRREAVAEIDQLLRGVGLDPWFCLGALVALQRIPALEPHCALLDLSRSPAELLVVEEGAPKDIRTLPWRADAASDDATVEATALQLSRLVEAALPETKGGHNGSRSPLPLYLRGACDAMPQLIAVLQCLLPGAALRPLETGAGNGDDLAALRSIDPAGIASLPFIRVAEDKPEQARRSPRREQLGALAPLAGLLLLSVFLGGVEPALRRRDLEAQLAARGSASSPALDNEIALLETVAARGAPALEALASIAAAAPSGVRVDLFTVSRAGELSVRGRAPSASAIGELRQRLQASGRFNAVAVDEETPRPEKNEVEFRLTAQCRVTARGSLAEQGKGRS